MLPVPEASVPAVDICSDKSAQHDTLSVGDIVIRMKHQLQPVPYPFVVVDDIGDIN